jgi:hypothetical protein
MGKRATIVCLRCWRSGGYHRAPPEQTTRGVVMKKLIVAVVGLAVFAPGAFAASS